MDNIIAKLKALSRDKKNQKELPAFVDEISSQNMDLLISTKLMSSSGPDILNALFLGYAESPHGHTKRLKMVRSILSNHCSSECPATMVKTLTTALLLEMPKFSSNHLAAVANDCIDRIRDNSDMHTSWKNILPECLRLLRDRSGTLNQDNSEMSGEEFSTRCVHALCQTSWQSSLVTPLAAMFREIQLSKDDHSLVVNKLCCDFDQLGPDSLPPLLHQLLRLCNDQHGTMVFFRVADYFTSRLFPSSMSQEDGLHDSESPIVDPDEIEQYSTDQVWRSHATCLFVASNGGAAMKRLPTTLKAMARRPAAILAKPPLIQVMLVNSHYWESSIQVLRTCLTLNFLEEQKRLEFSWCADTIPKPVDVKILVKNLLESSNNHCHITSEGLLALSSSLLSSGVGPVGGINLATALRNVGKLLAVWLAKKTPGAARPVLQLLRDSLGTGNAAQKHLAETLGALCREAPASVTSCCVVLQGILEDCLTSRSEDTISSRLLVLESARVSYRNDSRLRDTLFMVCRKGLSSRDPGVGRVAVRGLLCLLRSLKGDEIGFSQDTGSTIHSVLTQISIDVHSSQAGSSFRPKVNDGAVCLEIVSLLRKCFNQNADVKEELYKGLPRAILGRPALLTLTLDLLQEQLTSKYLAPGPEALPPLLVENCVKVKDGNVYLQEPIGRLIFTIVNLLYQAQEDEDADEGLTFGPSNFEMMIKKERLRGSALKLYDLMTTIAEQMAKCTPIHLKLDDGIPLNGADHTSASRRLVLQQALQAIEALQALSPPTSILALHKAAQGLKDFTKTNSKAKKLDKTIKKSQKSPKSQLQSKNESSQPKKKKIKATDIDKGTVFKMPDTVFDLVTVARVFELLYGDMEDQNGGRDLLRSRRELHRDACHAAITIVKEMASDTYSRGARSNIPEPVFKCGRLLYMKCIARLDDFCDFDQETGLLVVESFHELLLFVIDCHQKDMFTYLEAIGDFPSSGGLASQLSSLAKVISVQLLSSSTGSQDSTDPSAAKLPSVLAKLFAKILEMIPSNTKECDLWTEWMMTQCSGGKDARWLGTSLITPVLNMAARSASPWTAVTGLNTALLKIMGSIEDTATQLDPSDAESGPFSCLSSTSAPAAYISLCSRLTSRLAAAELVAGRLRSEYTGLKFRKPSDQHAAGSCLKNRERAVCTELCQLSNECRRLALVQCPAGACCTAALRLLTRFYALLASLAVHFTVRDKALLSARFDKVVKVSGRYLSHSVDLLIAHAECSSGEVSEMGPAMSAKVLRDTKHIPRLVYEMENFCKRITQLSSKTKIDLVKHLSKSSARDFRIKVSEVREALKNNSSEHKTDSDEEEMTVIENDKNDSEEENNIDELIDNAELGDSENSDEEPEEDDESSKKTSHSDGNTDDSDCENKQPKKKKSRRS